MAYIKPPRSPKKFECGIHAITYEALSPGCPVCRLERENDQMRKGMQELTNKLAMVTDQNLKLTVQVNISFAMREAIPLLNDEDMEFLKLALYQWRDEKSIVLKTTHGARKKKGQMLPANGFIAIPRRGDPWGHRCTSLGGLAIADYYDEAMNSQGQAEAMKLLARGLAGLLPGGGQ